ncbi:MAG TPA: hypothetical protein VMS12_05360, partial [Thermoanaerobaculia bacterium]|nr:hypothetical protein [Thermoanaerobaculia bacterium]
MKRIVILINFLLVCGTGYAFDSYIAAAARAEGANGTFFQSDLRLVNLSSTAADVDLTFLPSNTDNQSALPVRVSIGPRESLDIDDVLGNLFSVTSGVGAIRIVSESDLAVTSRTYTPSGDPACLGTFGQSIPASPADDAVEKGVIPNVSVSVGAGTGFRSNFGAVNPSTAEVSVRVTLRDGSGAAVGSADLTLPPYGHIQQSVASLFNAPLIETTNGFIEVDASAALLSYASVVDNLSGDPIFVPAQPDTGTPRDGLTIIAKQWVFEPEVIEVNVGEPVTLQVRAVDVDHGISFSGVGPFTCT